MPEVHKDAPAADYSAIRSLIGNGKDAPYLWPMLSISRHHLLRETGTIALENTPARRLPSGDPSEPLCEMRHYRERQEG